MVYVKIPDQRKPTFEGREIVIGPRAGDHYVVLSGLEEGEEIVTRGNFKIDSALQIQAKPSMMHPRGGSSGGEHHHHGAHQKASPPPNVEVTPMKTFKTPETFQKNLASVMEAYFQISTALASDNLADTREGYSQFGKVLESVQVDELSGEALSTWKEITRKIKNEIVLTSTTNDLKNFRNSFRKLSGALIHAEHSFGHADGSVLYEAFCPMAFDGEGDSWLQSKKTIQNPYFGKIMLRCGEIRKELSSHPSGDHSHD